MGLHTDTSAALVYLILYAIIFMLLLFAYLTGRMKLRSRYTLILFHVTIRLASQGTGLAFGIVGFGNTSLLVAYFVLGGKDAVVFELTNQAYD
jgi:cytochrome b561